MFNYDNRRLGNQQKCPNRMTTYNVGIFIANLNEKYTCKELWEIINESNLIQNFDSNNVTIRCKSCPKEGTGNS
jgi:uncharacterized ubiquitin-like protein YukD